MQSCLTSFFQPGKSTGSDPKSLMNQRQADFHLRLRLFEKEGVRLLQVNTKTKVGRPTKANERSKAVLLAAKVQYKRDLEKVIGDAEYKDLWDALDTCEDYIRRCDPNILPSVASDTDQPSEDVENEQPDPNEPQVKSKVVHALQIGLMHVWNEKGGHERFSTVEEYQALCMRLLGRALTTSTASQQLQTEKENYDKGLGMRSRPTLKLITSIYEEMKQSYLDSRDEPPAYADTSNESDDDEVDGGDDYDEDEDARARKRKQGARGSEQGRGRPRKEAQEFTDDEAADDEADDDVVHGDRDGVNGG